MQDLNQALLILVIGMFTVFIILSLVVLTGMGLIRVTNYLAREPLTPRSSIRMPVAISPNSSKKIAAITAAVNIVTEGKGKIERIEKL